MNPKFQELAQQQAGSILMDLVMPDACMPERIKWNIGCTIAHLEKFANLVAAHEREQCLKLVGEQIHNMTILASYPEQSGAIYQAIINIRARGEK
jgi:hypothetical protein